MHIPGAGRARGGNHAGRRVLVAGGGVSGAAAARLLRTFDAVVTVAEADPGRAAGLREEGFGVVGTAELPAGTELVVVSPGWRPDSPLLTAAAAAGVEVYGEVELAWRVRPGEQPAPWLAVTGTNGKTTTVQMLAEVLRAAGLRAVAAGNVGLPLVDAVRGPCDVLAVELSSFQLHWSQSVAVHAGAVLNIADDHLDWHGGPGPYAAAKARVWRGARHALGGVDDPAVAALLPEGGTGVTLGVPRAGQLGLVEDLLVDRAFDDSGRPAPVGEATELATLADLTVPGPHNAANALAAAALARSLGVPPSAVAAGLRGFAAGPHRAELVRVLGGVRWVDDSKATNPHAAAASLLSVDPEGGGVVWVAGGLLKGASVEDLVARFAPALRAVVLLGVDPGPFERALAQHAPHLSVVRAPTGPDVMVGAVRAAAGLARPGDTVLLAPAAASMDQFRDYADRGEQFAAAVAALSRSG